MSGDHAYKKIALLDALPTQEMALLAKRLGLPLLAAEDASYDYFLLADPMRLVPAQKNPHGYKPFCIDFLSGKIRYRCEQASLRKELIARAIGFHPAEKRKIVDATAGLARDSFILASLGYQVTLIERCPILVVLLEDALKRAALHPLSAPIIKQMQLIEADAIDWIQNQRNLSPDVIYIDPMFPARNKTAAVKKEMAILHDLILDDDQGAEKLFNLALTCAIKRVVVKRPRLGSYLKNHQADFSLKGETCRFDVYLIRE